MPRRVVNRWALNKLLQSLGLLLCLLVPVELMAADSMPPLLKQTKVLACAQTASEAQVALSRLWEIEDAETEFPDENMRASDETTLHAATLDIVLKSIVNTSERFPSLRNQVERTLLKWNYCDVFQEGVFYDLKQSSEGLVRTKAAAKSPENWQGFKALGFLGENENRFIPNILALDQQSLRSDYEWLFHRIFREQCFPHPDTSELFDSTEYRLKERMVLTADTPANEYPYAWDPECVYSRQAPTLTTRISIESMPLAIPALKSQVQVLPVPQLVPGLETNIVMSQIALSVPALGTRFLLEPTAFAVPKLSTLVQSQPTGVAVPKLTSRVLIDKPKIVVKKTKVKIKAKQKTSVNYVAKRDQHNLRAVVKPQVMSNPNIVLDKNASLLERILGGLSGGGNVLIVDKIQLTVNEYNGTVETVISSSDIGKQLTTTTTETQPAFVKSLIQTLPVIQKKPISKPSPYVLVPDLESMLLVSQVARAGNHKPVQIRSKVTRSKKPAKRNKKRITSSSLFTYDPYPNDKPAEKSIEQLLLEYQEYEEGRKLGKHRLKKKQLDSYPETPINQPQLRPRESHVPLLTPKLWIEKIEEKGVAVPALKSKVRIYKKYRMKPVRVPTLNSKIWINNKKHKMNFVAVPALKSKVRIFRKYRRNLVQVPALNTRVLQQLAALSKPTKKTRQAFKLPRKRLSDEVFEQTIVRENVSTETFAFSTDRLPDHVFEDTLVSPRTTAAVTTPTFLSNDAPLPYVIEERFNDKRDKQSKPKKKTIGLAGNIYLKQSLKNSAKAIGGSINRKLIKDNYWFARVGWNYTLEESDDPFTYSWGIGYSDWHPGTFSAQLNNWGPIKPDEGLALEKAVANFGYSVKSAFLKKHRLSLSGSVNVPVEGNSSIVGNIRWSPKENWFVNASVSQPLEGDGTAKWTYGFGYSDWRPNKINLQYSNYGPNEIPYHNYEANGTWSLSYNWKF